MNEIRIRNNGELLSEQDYMARFPNVSFAENFIPDDADRVIVKAPPNPAAHQRAVRNGVKQAGGKWVQSWVLQPLSVDELAALKAEGATAKRAQQKKIRAELIEQLVVTVGNKSFNGDETSQDRMMRRIFDMQSRNVENTVWTLSDNTHAQVTIFELREALSNAVQQVSELWAIEE